VFTHLLEGEAERYVRRGPRARSRPGGTLFATWFLLDDGSRAAVESGAAALPFLSAARPRRGWSATPCRRRRSPSTAGGCTRTVTAATASRCARIHDGTWRGETDPPAPTFQDVVVADKKGTPTPMSHREIDVHFQGAEKAVCAHQVDGFLIDPRPDVLGRDGLRTPSATRRRAPSC